MLEWLILNFFSYLLGIVIMYSLCIMCDVYRNGKRKTNLSIQHTTDKMALGTNCLPAFCVDVELLKPMIIEPSKRVYMKPCRYYEKVYEINGTIFREGLTEVEDARLTAFEVQTGGKPVLTVFESIDIHLPVTIQKTLYGFIINTKVLLTADQWNTLVESSVAHKCLVCDTIVDNKNAHMDSFEHKRELEKHQPLKKFDLSITRLIKNTYHCGVCNDRFGTDQVGEHFKSNSHRENMLFVRKKARDVMFDANTIHTHTDKCTPQTTDGGSYNLPEVYVDEHILKPTMLNYLKDDLEESSLYNDKVYETNGSIFREYVTKSSDKGILTAFEIRTGGKMKLTILESSDKHLPISIQETPYGLIINSKVLLTTKQWNTLVDHNDTQKCIVCGTTVSDTSNHVNSDVHKRNLKKYQPLKEFDLNITRLIEDMYHCSVCNESFDIDKDSEHFASKSHVQNMLFAQNRMSDVIDDLDTHYGYDRYNGTICSKRQQTLSELSSSSEEGFYGYYIDNGLYVDYKNNEYGNIGSYAWVAKRTSGTPDYLDVTIFETPTKMKFDHWHMIITFKSHKQYCMACKKYIEKAQKGKHCLEGGHLAKLESFKFVEDYRCSFVRQTGSNYYHCGVCNNLQTISDIDEHIRFKHKAKIIHALEIFRESRNDCTNDNTNAITEKEITDAQKGTPPPANFNVLLNENVRIDQVNEDQTERQTTINESNDNVTHISTINATNDIKIGNENKGDQFITEANTNKDLKTDINDNNDDQINIESNTSNNTKTDINENKGEETKIETNAINDVKTDINESNDDEMNMKTNTINDMKSDIIVSNDDKISFKTNTKHDMNTDINKSNVNQTNIETNTGNDINTGVNESNDNQIKIETNTGNDIKTGVNETHDNQINIETNKGNDIKTDVNESNENQINKETNTNNNMKIDINKNNALAISNENECNDKEYEINNENPSIFNDILINKFGTTLRVSFISYNLVSRRQNVYHCSMCDKTACDTDMTCHIKEPCHVVKLKQLPFQEKSCVNLIRTVGLQNHCTICNIIFKSNQTESHIIESNHVKCLSVALAINKPTMHPVALGVYPLPIPRPMIRPIIINNQKQIPHPTVLTNVRPMIPPTLAINQWPTLPPPRGTKPLFDSPIKDLNRNAKQPTTAPKNYKNPSETFMNQAPVRQPKNRTNSIIKLDTEQREIDSNKRNASLPILKIVEPKNHTNQGATGLALNENNQHTVTKLKIDTKKPKTDKNQRATDSSKKDDGKIESVVDMLDVDESLSDADDDYDFFNEKFVYLKFKNTFIQVSLVSYNSLVNTGDGTRYCFVCMLRICGSLKKHVESKNHEKCMDECKFVNKYDRHLLRQMFLNYHCSVCNIIITRKYVNQHIAWPLHEPDTKTDKKTRRTHIKAGGKIQNITFQNEAIYPNENETDIKVLVKIEIKANSQNVEQIQKKNKIILFGQKVLKISWDSYHGFSKHRGGNRCMLCVSDVRGYELSAHIGSEIHRGHLDHFEVNHLPQLIRKVNESTLNCVICNVEVVNKEHIITEHLCSKRHKKNYDGILLENATADSYADCNEDVLNLHSNRFQRRHIKK